MAALPGDSQRAQCRFLAPIGGWGMPAIPPLSGDKQTFGERAKHDRAACPSITKVSGREHANQTLETSRPVGVSDLGDRERFARVPERNLDRSLEALLLFHD